MKLDTGLATGALADVGRYAAAAEEMGFDGLWSVETSQDPYLPLTLVAEHTSRLSFGPAIAVAFPRSPLVHAQIAWDLQRQSGGRFILGLGTQVKGHNERRFGIRWEAPGPRLREMIEQEDISWFPVNKAICLQLGAEDEQDASHKLDALNTTMHDLVREQGEMLLRVLEENRQTSMREMANIRQRLDAINLHNKEEKENVEKLRESQKMMHESLGNLTVDGSSTGGSGGGGGMPPSFSSPMKAQSMPSINLMSQVNESPAEQPATNSSRRQSELDASQTITVCVTNCQDLVVPHLLGSADPFVVANVFWNGVKVGETETIWYGTAHPAWKNVGRNTFKITISKNDDVRAGKLSVEVNHTHRRGAGSFLGVAEVTGQQIMGAGDSSQQPCTGFFESRSSTCRGASSSTCRGVSVSNCA